MLQKKRGKFFLVAVILLVLIVFAQIRQASRDDAYYFPATQGFDGFSASSTQSQDWNKSTPGGNIGGTRDCFYYNDPSSGSSVMTGC